MNVYSGIRSPAGAVSDRSGGAAPSIALLPLNRFSNRFREGDPESLPEIELALCLRSFVSLGPAPVVFGELGESGQCQIHCRHSSSAIRIAGSTKERHNG